MDGPNGAHGRRWSADGRPTCVHPVPEILHNHHLSLGYSQFMQAVHQQQLVHNNLVMSEQHLNRPVHPIGYHQTVCGTSPQPVYPPSPTQLHHPMHQQQMMIQNQPNFYIDGFYNENMMSTTVAQHHHIISHETFSARRRFRTNFSESQSQYLEDSFKESHYPDHNAKKDMAVFLNIPEDRITVWFQNRRAKWRRKENRVKSHSVEQPRPDSDFVPQATRSMDADYNYPVAQQQFRQQHIPEMIPFDGDLGLPYMNN